MDNDLEQSVNDDQVDEAAQVVSNKIARMDQSDHSTIIKTISPLHNARDLNVTEKSNDQNDNSFNDTSNADKRSERVACRTEPSKNAIEQSFMETGYGVQNKKLTNKAEQSNYQNDQSFNDTEDVQESAILANKTEVNSSNATGYFDTQNVQEGNEVAKKSEQSRVHETDYFVKSK